MAALGGDLYRTVLYGL